MVAMAVDWPVRENYVGAFGSQQAREVLVMRGIDDRAAVILAGEGGSGFKGSTGALGFRGSNRGTAIEAGSAAEPFAAIQVQQNNLVAQVAIARHRPGAAAFRVSWMAARHDDLQGLRRRFSQQRQSRG
jgi:hypothetical protein